MSMPLFHHVNLGVPPDGLTSEADFLVQVLGFRAVERNEALAAIGAWWFEGEDGAQIHLSADPDHRPAARAHVAISYGSDLDQVEKRLRDQGIDCDRFANSGFPPIVICLDPAGNRWELRGAVSST